ncbi:MAG: carph-isopro domain-containing protein [Gammaproteobacteria bacterium]
MMNIQSFKQIVDLWPSVNALADDLGESPAAVYKWRTRNNIPVNHWLTLIEAGEKRGFSINPRFLIGLVDRRTKISSNEPKVA